MTLAPTETIAARADAPAEPSGTPPRWRRLVPGPTARSVLVALVISTLPYWEVVSGHRSAMYGDVNDFFVPRYQEVWRSITAGHAPFWTPFVFAGQSMVGSGQYAVFYPLNSLFGVLAPVTAYRWWLLAHIWIAAGGAFAWSWYRFRSRAGAIVCAVAYAGCGALVLELVHPFYLIGAAWLPFAFLGADLVQERWTTPRAALVALPLALIAFAGHPQMIWIALVGVAVYTVARAAFETGSLARIGRVAAATVLGLGVAAVQLLPLWLYSRTSVRPSLPMQSAFELSEKQHGLLNLAFPWLYGGSTQGSVFSSPWLGGDTQHEVGMFAGVTVLALAAIALVALWRNATVRALTIVAVLATLFGLGGSTPFGHVFYDVVPLAKSFRAWARTLVLLNLVLAMLAGIGVREVMRAPRRFVAALAWATIALAVVAIWIPHVHSLRKFLAAGPYGLIARTMPVLFLLALLAAVAVMVMYPRAGAVALVAVCSVEIVSFVYPAEWRGASAPVADLQTFYDKSAPTSVGSPYDAPGGVDRWATDSYGFRMLSLVKELHGVNGYDSLIQKEWADTVAGFTYDGYPTRPDLWQTGWLSDILRVTTLVLNNKITPGDPSWQRSPTPVSPDQSRWTRDPRLPDAYLVGHVNVESLDGIRAAITDPATPMQSVAYVDRADRSVLDLHDDASPGQVASADVDRGRFVVDADRPGLLVVSEGWERGWHATVDGHDAPVLRTDGVVLGVPVPAGHHVVRLRFRPPGLGLGLVITIVSLVVLVAAAPVARRIRAFKRRPPPGAPAASPAADRT